jgi:1,2-diacylglycerol 3-beta-galactosyltransferase
LVVTEEVILKSSSDKKSSTKRICLVFSDTGGGHRSATEAIHAAMQYLLDNCKPDQSVEIHVENIVEKSHPINRRFVELYNYLLRHQQQAMKYYYWFIETFKPNDSEFGWQITRPYLNRYVGQLAPDVVVSVHPMTNQYLARAIKECGLKKKSRLITVVTDPNGDFWSGWANKDSELTIVPNDLAKKRLIDLGIEKNRIAIMGMPVHPDFSMPASCTPSEFRTRLNLDTELPTICINAGWAGGGNMLSIYRALANVRRKIQVIFLCGHNKHLYDTIKRESARYKIPTAVLPFHDRMSDVMASCDLMVTKAGGLTSFESIARRLPLAIDMITKPMPQELGTARMLVSQGLAYDIEQADDIVPVVENLRLRSDGEPAPLPTAHQLDHINASFDIAYRLLDLAGVKLQAPPEWVRSGEEATELL